VSDGLNALKEEDVQRLARLIESLDSSNFDYMQLQVGDLKVTIGKGALPGSAPAVEAPRALAYAPLPQPLPVAVAHTPVAASPPPIAPAPPPTAAALPPLKTKPPGKRAAASTAPAGTIEIKSQIMGMFYPQPEPGSPPFVSLGTEVKEDTTVCLIEVMKTFNAMTAGVKGVITEICAENAQLVEYGQVLFRIRPS
jgi:acetyl-CoA carboxylase biotin carboxyl carrier protein